jgi:hypothetical protein
VKDSDERSLSEWKERGDRSAGGRGRGWYDAREESMTFGLGRVTGEF